MKRLTLKARWLQEILPDGFPYPSTTLVSGPGGSGKAAHKHDRLTKSRTYKWELITNKLSNA